MRVLHLPTTVGGNPQGLSRHLKELGINSETWTLTQNFFAYPADKVISNENDPTWLRRLKKLAALRYCMGSYDIVHFNFGQPLFNPYFERLSSGSTLTRLRYFCENIVQLLELNLLRLRRIPMFIHYQGDDARQGGFCLKNFEITIAKQVDSTYYNATSDRHKKLQIERLGKYCDKIYAVNPDLLYVLPSHAEFIPYSHLSFEEWHPIYTQLQQRPLKIGHAPSNRAVKGTELVLQALEQLKGKGYQFDLVLIEGMSHGEAMQCYRDIDVLVDQLFAGWYGGLAVEAMALGKPVLVYIREEDLQFIPAGMKQDLPFIQVTPATLEEVLISILEMPRLELYKIAQKSRAYVEKWHNPIDIANRVKTDYEMALKKRGKF